MSQIIIEIGLSSQGCCLTGAWSPEALIYPKMTNILNGEPQQMPKTYYFQANFWWTNYKIPCSFGTFETKTGNV